MTSKDKVSTMLEYTRFDGAAALDMDTMPTVASSLEGRLSDVCNGDGVSLGCDTKVSASALSLPVRTPAGTVEGDESAAGYEVFSDHRMDQASVETAGAPAPGAPPENADVSAGRDCVGKAPSEIPAAWVV